MKLYIFYMKQAGANIKYEYTKVRRNARSLQTTWSAEEGGIVGMRWGWAMWWWNSVVCGVVVIR